MQFLLHVMQIIGQNEKTSDGVSFMAKAVFSAVRRPEKGRKYRFGKRGGNVVGKAGVLFAEGEGAFLAEGRVLFRGRRVFSRGWRGGGFVKRGGFPLRSGGRFFAGRFFRRAAGCGWYSGSSLRPTQFCELQILYMLFPPFVTQKVEPKCAAVKRFRGRSCDFAESDAFGTFEAIKRSPILYAPSLRPPSVRNRFCRGMG